MSECEEGKKLMLRRKSSSRVVWTESSALCYYTNKVKYCWWNRNGSVFHGWGGVQIHIGQRVREGLPYPSDGLYPFIRIMTTFALLIRSFSFKISGKLLPIIYRVRVNQLSYEPLTYNPLPGPPTYLHLPPSPTFMLHRTVFHLFLFFSFFIISRYRNDFLTP